MAKRWLVVFPGYKFMCFFDAKVIHQWIVVMPAKKLCSDDFWDVGEAMVM